MSQVALVKRHSDDIKRKSGINPHSLSNKSNPAIPKNAIPSPSGRIMFIAWSGLIKGIITLTLSK